MKLSMIVRIAAASGVALGGTGCGDQGSAAVPTPACGPKWRFRSDPCPRRSATQRMTRVRPWDAWSPQNSRSLGS
jgi:hypothetical protein